MPHVTFIHGISNKPPARDLLNIWRRTMENADPPLPLGDLGVTSSLVYWADLLYEKPDEDVAAHEGALESTPEAVDGGGDVAPLIPANAEEAAFIEGLRAKLTAFSDGEIEAGSPPEVSPDPQGALESIPLPWSLKKRFMAAWLRDVHHYLFDVEFAPPGNTPVRIQQTIRKRFVDALRDPEVTRPHVVVSHSMGTVIAYDCLKRVPDCAEVDGLITLGSPLGLDEIQEKLQPGWTPNDGYPREKVAQGWVNVFDRLDPVCGFDPNIANDYVSEGKQVIEDLQVHNTGKWKHSATKYMRQPNYCKPLRKLLEV